MQGIDHISWCEVLLGAFLSILITIGYEWIKRPKLFVSEEKKVPKPVPYKRDWQITGYLSYSHVRAKVSRFSRFLGREVAHDCRGKIFFYNISYETVFYNGLPLSWVNHTYDQTTPLDMKQYMDVAPGTAKGFNIISHEKKTGKIWVMSNEPEWHLLNPEFYYVKVEIESTGKPIAGYLELNYINSTEGYLLKIVEKKKVRKLRRQIKKNNVTENHIVW